METAESPDTDQVTIDVHLGADGPVADLLDDARTGFTSENKYLPRKYVYDETGSQLFEQITELPEYYPTRAERQILTEQAADIVAAADAECLVELGSGAASKTRALLDAMRAAGSLQTYVPVDISEEITRRVAVELTSEYPGLRVHGVVCDFEADLERLPAWGQRRMIGFFGGTVGNFAPDDRGRLLKRIAAMLGPRDSLLVGTDLVKDRDRLEAAYNDSAGVTERFNKNVLSVVNRELGAEFDPALFEHLAFYDAENERIDIRLRSLTDQRVFVSELELEVVFAAGEDLRTEMSCKFTPASIEAMYSDAGLALDGLWTDRDGLYALSLARPHGSTAGE